MNSAVMWPELYGLTGVESDYACGKTREYSFPIHDPLDIPRYDSGTTTEE